MSNVNVLATSNVNVLNEIKQEDAQRDAKLLAGYREILSRGVQPADKERLREIKHWLRLTDQDIADDLAALNEANEIEAKLADAANPDLSVAHAQARVRECAAEAEAINVKIGPDYRRLLELRALGQSHIRSVPEIQGNRNRAADRVKELKQQHARAFAERNSS